MLVIMFFCGQEVNEVEIWEFNSFLLRIHLFVCLNSFLHGSGLVARLIITSFSPVPEVCAAIVINVLLII